MMSNQYVRILEPGKVYIDYGPISMVAIALKKNRPITDFYQEIFPRIKSILEKFHDDLQLYKKYFQEIDPIYLTDVGRKMYQAVELTKDPTMTPLAAVAGAVADEIADWLYMQGATKVIINNGGDISVRLESEEEVKLGLISSISIPDIHQVVKVKGNEGIGGIATSGFGGRSFTRGIADSVSVMAKNCTIADALATHLANVSYVASRRVHVDKAGKFDALSDIKELDVVYQIDGLEDEEIKQGFRQIKEEAERLYKKGHIKKMVATIQGNTMSYPTDY